MRSQDRDSSVVPLSGGWPGRYIHKCAALWRDVYGPFSTERPFGTIRKEKGIYSLFSSVYLIEV